MVRGETGAQGVTPITAELRDNGENKYGATIVTTISGAVVNTTDFPSGGNAVVRGEAGAKGTTPMTMSEIQDSATHDVEAEAEKKKIAGAHQKIAGAQEMTQVRQATVEPGPTTVKDVRAGETNADSAKRPSAEVGCGRLHQTLAAATTKKMAGNANHRMHAHVTQDSLTTVEPGLTTVKEVRAGETNADSAAVNERPSAEVGCGRLHQTFAAYTAAAKRRGCKATLQIVSPPPQQKLSLTQQRRRSVHRAQAAKRARRPARITIDPDILVAKVKEMLAAHDEAHAAASDGNTKRVRSDKGTRAVQELHGQHPSLND